MINVIPSDALLDHWQGHRRLTRRVIEAFPEDQLFTFSVGGMRPFGVLAMELATMGAPFLKGAVTGTWEASRDRDARPKADLLRLWDACTEEINSLWHKLPADRYHATLKAWGQYEGPFYTLLLYVIDNEIHHRGQGYVYLRALGIEPPPFYERG
jgi:uncharacterized damage-inducible protein DinB